MDQFKIISNIGKRFCAAFPKSYLSMSCDYSFFRSGHTEKKWHLYMLITEEAGCKPTTISEYYLQFSDVWKRLDHFLTTADGYKPDPDEGETNG